MKLKKLLASVLAVGMMASALGQPMQSTVYAAQTTQSASQSIEVGQVINGFEVIRSQYDKTKKAQLILFEHQRTGAELMWIKNNDQNRGFSIGFRTPAPNSKGINHILEHALISGSEKYPDRNLFFSVLNGTYTSFINAFTYQNLTMYPLASNSETQLMKLTDIYLDAVYHPNLLTDKRIFEREGWRYELASEEDPIIINGTVYNEMRGNYSNIMQVAILNAFETVYGGTDQANIAAGKPSEILTLTYEEVLDFYNTYYHPSNSFMTLYGDLDCSSFLKMIDEDYLSEFTAKNIRIARQTTPERDRPLINDFYFPTSKDANTKNKSIIDVVFVLDDMRRLGIDTLTAFNVISASLNSETSSFSQALARSGIAQSYGITLDAQSYQPAVHFLAQDADPSRKQEFYDLVIAELKKIAENGFDQTLLKSMLNSLKFSEALNNEGAAAENTMVTAQLMNVIFGNPMADEIKSLYTLEDKLDNGYLEGMVQKHLVECKRTAIVTTIPKAGLLEQNDAALAEKLADMKESMSELQLNTLLKKTLDYVAWNNAPTKPEVLASIKAVSTGELPTDVREYPIQERTTGDGVRLLTATADIANVNQTGLSFDVGHLTNEELQYLNLYLGMFNNILPTDSRSYSDILNQAYSLTSGMGAYLSGSIKSYDQDDTAYPSCNVDFYALQESYPQAVSLVMDMLLNGKLEGQQAALLQTLDNLILNMQTQFAEPLNLTVMRAYAHTSTRGAYMNYFNGIELYEFAKEIRKAAQTNPASVLSKIQAVRDKAFQKDRLTITFAGDAASISTFHQSERLFTDGVGQAHYENLTRELPKPAQKEALTANLTVQYLARNASLQSADAVYEGGHLALETLLQNTLLIPKLRYNGGAYGAFASLQNQNSLILYTYRDNNFANSLEVMEQAGSFLDQSVKTLDEAELDNYVLSAFAQYTKPRGELTDAFRTVGNYAVGYTTEREEEILSQLKNVTVEDIAEYADMLKKLNEGANYVAALSPDMAEKYKELFDEVIPLQ